MDLAACWLHAASLLASTCSLGAPIVAHGSRADLVLPDSGLSEARQCKYCITSSSRMSHRLGGELFAAHELRRCLTLPSHSVGMHHFEGPRQLESFSISGVQLLIGHDRL